MTLFIKTISFIGACVSAGATIELLYSQDWLLAFVFLVFCSGFSVIQYTAHEELYK